MVEKEDGKTILLGGVVFGLLVPFSGVSLKCVVVTVGAVVARMLRALLTASCLQFRISR